MSYTRDKLVNLLYPAKCIFCRDPITPRDGLLVCSRCLTRYGAERGAVTLPRGLGRCRYALVYQTSARDAVLRFKFSGRVQYARTFAHFMKPLAEEAPADLIAWVPISLPRRIRRTYDQSRSLAAALSRQTGLPLVHALVKIRHNRAQSTLDAAERRKNVRGCYRALNRKKLEGVRVLLVDDVVTTGATLAECASVLYAAGAREVRCIALAHGGVGKK